MSWTDMEQWETKGLHTFGHRVYEEDIVSTTSRDVEVHVQVSTENCMYVANTCEDTA